MNDDLANIPKSDEIIYSACAGDRGPEQQVIAQQGIAFVAALLRKNADYGSSVWKEPLLVPGLSPGDAILVRMGDKVNRIGRLMNKPPEVVGESLRDTVADLGAYCLLWLANPEVQK